MATIIICNDCHVQVYPEEGMESTYRCPGCNRIGNKHEFSEEHE